MRATGVGSMPGEDVKETLRVVLGLLDDLVFVPELPARGTPAGMVGRTGALLHELGLDLQPAGWRLSDGAGIDQRRARSLLARDLDALEEQVQGFTGVLKQQVTGPWTLAAMVERPRGDKVLGDHGARRELAESLAQGVVEHLADLARRAPDAQLVLQVDEPALPAVLSAQVATASGFSRHRTVHPPEADALLRLVVEAADAAGARTVVHCCAQDVPVALLAGVGFGAISFDAAAVRPDDVWAEVLESGTDLWPGITPALVEEGERAARDRLTRFFGRWGHDPAELSERLVLTPACGLAGSAPDAARRTLAMLARIAADQGQTA